MKVYIISTEAILTYGAKKLYVEVYTNVSGAEILDMNPEPLPTTPRIDGQAENDGRKLAIHIPSASGNVQIAVKLIPMSAEGATRLNFIPIDSWNIEDGEIEKESFTVLCPLNGSLFRERNIPIMVYSAGDVPKAYIDGEEITLKNVGDGYFKGEAEYDKINLGKHRVKVVCGGNEKEITAETLASIDTEREYTIQNLGNVSSGVAEQCAGSDGSTDGGIKITRGEKNSYYRVTLNESSKTVFVDFDVKMPKDGVKFDLESNNGTSYTWFGGKELILPSGQIAGTDIFMPADEWHNIRIVQNLSNGGIFEIYYDGKLIKKGQSEYDMTNLKTMKIQVLSGSVCLDNFYYGTYKENPRYQSASYCIGDKSYEAENDIIKWNCDSIKIKFSPSFDALTKSDVTVNEKEVKNIQMQGEYIVVTLNEPLQSEKAVITFSSSLYCDGKKINKATDVVLFTDYYSDKIDVGEIIQSGDKAEFSVSITRSEVSSLPQKGMLIMAAYKGEEMVAISVKRTDLSGNISGSLPDLNGGRKVCVYLWGKGGEVILKKEADMTE